MRRVIPLVVAALLAPGCVHILSDGDRFTCTSDEECDTTISGQECNGVDVETANLCSEPERENALYYVEEPDQAGSCYLFYCAPKVHHPCGIYNCKNTQACVAFRRPEGAGHHLVLECVSKTTLETADLCDSLDNPSNCDAERCVRSLRPGEEDPVPAEARCLPASQS